MRGKHAAVTFRGRSAARNRARVSQSSVERTRDELGFPAAESALQHGRNFVPARLEIVFLSLGLEVLQQKKFSCASASRAGFYEGV